MINAKITGVGGYVPEKVYDNAYMESIVDTNDEWITRRTGIKERHISADNEYTTDMATIAAKRAIENAGLTPEDIDLIMLATVTPDYFTPACACVVQSNLGAVNAAAFDYNAACSGFVTGLTIAEQFIKAGTYKHIVVVCADTLSKATDYKDRATCVLFGDAAGAADFCKWVEDVLVDVINMTKEKMEKYYDEHVTDTMCRNEMYKKYYMDTIIEDTSAVAGLELIRRIVGMANVKDITTIADEAKRARAEKICITAAIDFIKNRSDKKCGKCFLKTLKDAIAEVDA